MDLADCIPSILDAVAGMTVDQVQAEIEASNIAPMVDSAKLAAFLVAASADPTMLDSLMAGTDSAPDTGDVPPPNPI